MLGSRDMRAKCVSQEASERASKPETSAHVINHMLLQFVIEHMLFFQSSSVLCGLSCLICSSKPLCNACPGCGGMVRKVICSCDHVFVAKHNKHLKAYTALLTKPRKEHCWNASQVTELVTVDFKVAFKEMLRTGQSL